MARRETSHLERAFQSAIQAATQAAAHQAQLAARARAELLELELVGGLKGRLTDEEQDRRRSLREDVEYTERLSDAHEEVARRLAQAFRPELKGRPSGDYEIVEGPQAQPEALGGEPHGLRQVRG